MDLKSLHSTLKKITKSIKGGEVNKKRGNVQQSQQLSINLAQSVPTEVEGFKKTGLLMGEEERYRKPVMLAMSEDIKAEESQLDSNDQHFLRVIRHKYLVILKSLYQEFYEKG